jgi:hypothetical protein
MEDLRLARASVAAMYRKRSFPVHYRKHPKILEFEHVLVFQNPFQNQNTKTWQLIEFWYICNMSSEQKKRLLKAKVAVALQSELGRVPTKKEIDQVSLLARVMYKAVLGLHYKRGEQKKSGQLAIF